MLSRRLSFIAALTYVLLTFIVVYFKYFPTIVNEVISNFLLIVLFFSLILLLVYGTFLIKKTNDVFFLLPQSLLISFLARAVPNIRLSYPPLHDPYFHFICTLNILEHETLKPILNWWYYDVDKQLHWPDMHLITVTLAKITTIDVMQFFRFQEPFLGVVFFLAIFCLTKTATNNDGIALLAGLFASINDIIIFYQSEYHPQGISIVYFMLLLYAFTKSRQVIGVQYRYLSLILGLVFITSHHFTSLFLALIFSSYIIIMFVIRVFFYSNVFQDKYGDEFEDVLHDYTYFLVVIVTSFSYHLFIYFRPLKGFVYQVSKPVIEAQLISIGQMDVPLFSSILSSFKWGLFVLAIISILLIVKSKNIDEFRLGIIVVCILCAGVIGNYFINLPLDRIICFYVPFASIFASFTLHRFKHEWLRDIHENKKMILAVLIASIIMTAGFFNSQIPAYFFEDSEVNTYYWYSNKLPSMDEYKDAGEWIGNNSIPYSKYGTEFDTHTIPFFYGNQSLDLIKYQPKNTSFNYMLTNPKIPYKYNNKTAFVSNLSLIYNNNELEIYFNK